MTFLGFSMAEITAGDDGDVLPEFRDMPDVEPDPDAGILLIMDDIGIDANGNETCPIEPGPPGSD